MSNKLFLRKEKHEKDEKSRCLQKDCGKRRASEPAREAGGKRQEATNASGQGPSRAGASTGRGSGQ